MRVDLLYHYAIGEVGGTLCHLLNLDFTQAEILTNMGGVAKELTDVTGFDILDLVAQNIGFIVGVF